MDVTRERIEAALARAEAATPGPWETSPEWTCIQVYAPGRASRSVDVVARLPRHDEVDANAQLIAAARDDVPDFARALLEAWEREKALYEALQNELVGIHDESGGCCCLCSYRDKALIAYEQAHPESAS